MRKQTFACLTKVKLSLRMSWGITLHFLNKRLSRARYALCSGNNLDLQVDVSKSYLG